MEKDRDAEGGIYSADSRIDRDIDANISRVKALFADWGDIVERRFTVRRTGLDVYAEDSVGSADETSASVGARYIFGVCREMIKRGVEYTQSLFGSPTA